MKIQINENFCLGCHLCEYYCAFAGSGEKYMWDAVKRADFRPRIRVEGRGSVTYAVSCRHCDNPLCVKGCIANAITKNADGAVTVDADKCVGCHTCILVCPFGAIEAGHDGKPVSKCELCLKNNCSPACAAHCPNGALVLKS